MRVGAKRKPPAVGQSWVAPFRYDNIESHIKKQHPSKWVEYDAVKKSWNSFTKPFSPVISPRRMMIHRASIAPLSWITFKLYLSLLCPHQGGMLPPQLKSQLFMQLARTLLMSSLATCTMPPLHICFRKVKTKMVTVKVVLPALAVQLCQSYC